MNDEKMACLYARRIPVDVKAQFKAWCAARGITLQDGIIRLMRQAIREGKRGNQNDL